MLAQPFALTTFLQFVEHLTDTFGIYKEVRPWGFNRVAYLLVGPHLLLYCCYRTLTYCAEARFDATCKSIHLLFTTL